MTEDEAKKKWCPFARAPIMRTKNGSGAVEFSEVGNRLFNGTGDELPRNALCLGSDCMAWRRNDKTHVAAMTQSRELRETAATNGWEVRDKHYSIEAIEPQGYCGLAGKP